MKRKLTYAKDYSPSFTSRSIIDSEYNSNNNGLSMSNDVIELKGELTKNTVMKNNDVDLSVNSKQMTGLEKWKMFINTFADMGSVLWYLAIGMCLVQYKAYGIMAICLIGAASSLYAYLRKK